MGTGIPQNPIRLDPAASDASAVLRFDVLARFWLGIIIIIQFVALVAYLQYSGKQLPNSELIIGAEIGMVSTVINFFFGSSSGSVTKSAKGEPVGAPAADGQRGN